MNTLFQKVSEVVGWVYFNWIKSHLERVRWGLDSVGCLGFLHGKEGVYRCLSSAPEWLEALSSRSEVVQLHWQDGRATILRNGRETEMKLGKWLRSVNATPEQLHEFETRGLSTWQWKVSANPWDILTMSHNRAWTSCMSPGGAYQQGMAGEMRAGSALLFWYRPGAGQPCGRELLRPCALNGKPVILRAGRLYGDGCLPSDEKLQEMLGNSIRVISGEATLEMMVLITGYIDAGGERTDENDVGRVEDALIRAFTPYFKNPTEAYSEVESLLSLPLDATKENPQDEILEWLHREEQKLEAPYHKACAKVRAAENNLHQPSRQEWREVSGEYVRVCGWHRSETDPLYPFHMAHLRKAESEKEEILSQVHLIKNLYSQYLREVSAL